MNRPSLSFSVSVIHRLALPFRSALRWLSVAVLLSVSSISSAYAAGELVTTLQAFKQVVSKDAAGKPVVTFVKFTKLLPAEEATFVVSCQNTSDAALTGIVVTLPIPAEMTFRIGSADTPGAAVDYSVDGGARYGLLDQLNVELPEGKVRPALVSDITTIRWVFTTALASKSTTEVRCLAVLK